MVTRYKDSSAIFAWELANEPRYVKCVFLFSVQGSPRLCVLPATSGAFVPRLPPMPRLGKK
jgi:hypothetical protein